MQKIASRDGSSSSVGRSRPETSDRPTDRPSSPPQPIRPRTNASTDPATTTAAGRARARRPGPGLTRSIASLVPASPLVDRIDHFLTGRRFVWRRRRPIRNSCPVKMRMMDDRTARPSTEGLSVRTPPSAPSPVPETRRPYHTPDALVSSERHNQKRGFFGGNATSFLRRYQPQIGDVYTPVHPG